MTCRFQNPSPHALSLRNFDMLHKDGKQLIVGWLDRALDQPEQDTSSLSDFRRKSFVFNNGPFQPETVNTVI